MRKTVLLLMAVLLACLPAQARDKRVYKLMGTILGRARVSPVEGVAPPLVGVPKCQVTLTPDDGKGQAFSATTDAMGNYLIDGVPPGHYTLSANRPDVGSNSIPMMVGGFQAVNNKNLTLNQPTAQTGQGLAPGSGAMPQQQYGPVGTANAPPAGGSGHLYIALAPLKAALQNHPMQAPTEPKNSFGGRSIPGPPNWNMGYKTAIMLTGDPFLLITGRPRRSPEQVFNEARNPMPISTDARALWRMDPNRPAESQYAHQQNSPYWITLNAQGTELFAATDHNTVDIYDLSTVSMLASIPMGGIPTDITRSPDGNWIFTVVAAGTPGVVVIDPRRNQAVRFIPTPAMSNGSPAVPTAVAVNNDSTRCYVSLSSPKAGEVVEIDTVTRKVLRRAHVGAQPLGLALTPDGRVLFVANNASATVSVVNTATMTQITQVHVGIAPCRIVVRPDGTKAYVSCKGSGTVAVIKGISPNAASIPVGTSPTGIAVSQDGHRVYVSNTDAGTVSTIDTDRDVVENVTNDQPNSRPFGIAVGP